MRQQESEMASRDLHELMSAQATPTRCHGKIESAAKTHKVLQAPRRTDAEQLAQDQTQVPASDLNQVAFLDFDQATQPGPARPTRFAHVGKTSFGQFASQALQTFATRTTYAPPIRVNRRAVRRRLVSPATAVRRLGSEMY